MSLGLNILLIFVFLLLGSVFAGTELALVSLRGSQIDQMEQEGCPRKARRTDRARSEHVFVDRADRRDVERFPFRIVRRIVDFALYCADR